MFWSFFSQQAKSIYEYIVSLYTYLTIMALHFFQFNHFKNGCGHSLPLIRLWVDIIGNSLLFVDVKKMVLELHDFHSRYERGGRLVRSIQRNLNELRKTFKL